MRYTDGFTGKAILALKEAICAAEELGHTYIGRVAEPGKLSEVGT